MMNNSVPIIIDNGTSRLRVGFANEDTPRALVPSVIGRPRGGQTAMMSVGVEDGEAGYIGEEALSRKSVLDVTCPIEKGIVTNWDDMEEIWCHILDNNLRVDTEDHPLLLTEVINNPKSNRERTAQIVFDTFCAPGMYLAAQPALSLYSSGRVTGLVLESGFSATHAVPVYEGSALPHASLTIDVAGKGLREYLKHLLEETEEIHSMFLSDIKSDVVLDDIKKKVCRIATDYDHDVGSCQSEVYELPDGRTITVAEECVMCPEALFRPNLLKADSILPGVHELCSKSIRNCDEDIRKDLYHNVILSGGNTLFSGFASRLEKELRDLPSPPNYLPRVIAPQDREHGVWLGGAVVASLPTFSELYVSKQEYDEFGPSIVHKKCF